jgi:transcriptional repressor NrdR
MKCPYCKTNNDRVIDSRTSGDAFVVRRRRECLECGKRFTTYEKVEDTPLRVIKKDLSRDTFDRSKILKGVLKACEKRSVSTDRLEEMVNKIEAQLYEMFDKEVSSKFIGRLVMDELREIDQVAYVRFASVYREFKDINQFLDELKPLLATSEQEEKKSRA